MLRIILILSIAIPSGVFDAWLYLTGRFTISTRIRDFSEYRPWMACAVAIAFLCGSIGMGWGQPVEPFTSGWITGGLACGLWVHWFTYKH